MSTNFKTRRPDYNLTRYLGSTGQRVQIGGALDRYFTLPLDRDLLLDLCRDLLDLSVGQLPEEET